MSAKRKHAPCGDKGCMECENADLKAKLRDRDARLRTAAKRLDPLIDWEMGEGTRGEVYDPLRDVLKLLDLKNKSWRKARGEGR